jgi:thiamine biosynthesis lipoprotein
MPDGAAAETVVGAHVVHVMGTVVSFDLCDPVPIGAYEAAVRVLHRADRRFSTYRPDSDISRLRRGEISVGDCHPDIDDVLGLCRLATEQTDGYFTAFPYGDLDPTGLVKGWAIERASAVLVDAGSSRHSVNGGGDIQLAGDAGRAPWRVGITDPADRMRIVAVAVRQDGAVATSGNAERGHHIVNPRTGLTADRFASVTITAGSLIDADVLATAAFARGEGAIPWVERMPEVDGLFVGHDGAITATTSFPFG